MKPLVVNLIGAPGSGKSTSAAYIFSKLKMLGYNAELITEFAKDKVYEKNFSAINNQVYVFAKQYYKMDRCKEQVDVIVTDSPIIVSTIYNKDKILGEDFNKLVLNVYNSFDNMLYFINRVKKYEPRGRYQKTSAEADKVGEKIKKTLIKYNLPYVEKPGNEESCNQIIEDVLKKLKSLE